MPFVTNFKIMNHKNTLSNEDSIQNHANHPLHSPAADALGLDSSSMMQDTMEDQGGSNHNRPTGEGPENSPAIDTADDGGAEEELGAFDDAHLQVDQPKKKKKKSKKSKPKSKRGLNAPSGFEEYSADAPITPAEYDEERKLYDLDLPFTDRIITAIHRYERRRKMLPATRDTFRKYLAYGGLDVTPNMFQGISERDAESMDKDTLTHALAQTSLSHEFRDIGKESSMWVVDFEGVMKGFLSRRVPFFYALDTEADVQAITTLLINFMNYLLHHDVCPEYREPILAAKQCCVKATQELWSIVQAQRWLPGDFNIACSTLFDGAYSRRYDGQTSWADDGGEFIGQTDDQARQIVKFAVACAGSEEQYQLWYEKAMANEIKVTKVRKEVGLEITEIILPDDETRDFYKQRTKDFRPVGKIHTKGWKNPSATVDDLTPEEQALQEKTLSQVKQQSEEVHRFREAGEDEYEFFVEEAVLQHLFVGMKLEATIRTLNCGICFVDEVFNAYLSFDTFLPNDRLYGYKKPRWLPGFSLGEDGLVKYDPKAAEKGEGNDVEVDDRDD
ncbi:hypothetical protein EPUS_02711 [Endocarpon pusillum Z07020]|uniref:Argonaute siRNA chaperone complex subunit Arb1 n=1 Tax=Endocarpon pusillum (strain Z07020 / HMAS-L-300199) TaxID=1263415 RepID=U1HDZ6_ENDPU|nr:uncharacterized protein EPUS_02711 [Endocarpon pusillum Z07020]ERF68255.1 hypothetical protein EPUS_02711 [Endocarpon pusillum Z07020]